MVAEDDVDDEPKVSKKVDTGKGKGSDDGVVQRYVFGNLQIKICAKLQFSLLLHFCKTSIPCLIVLERTLLISFFFPCKGLFQ